MKRYVVSERAVLKLLLHAARHSSSHINGVLIASKSAARDKGQDVMIVDVIPLFHTNSIIGPYLETAIVQIAAAADQNGQEIVGYYEADQRIKAPELSSTGAKAGDLLLANAVESAVVFVLDNNKFGDLLRQEIGLPFEIYTKDGDRWKRAIAAGEASVHCQSSRLSESLNRHLRQKTHYALCDFDDHLDDVSKDWLNASLVL